MEEPPKGSRSEFEVRNRRMNVACPHCRGLVADTPHLRGQVIACPHCGGHFMLPMPAQAVAAVPRAAAIPTPPAAAPPPERPRAGPRPRPAVERPLTGPQPSSSAAAPVQPIAAVAPQTARPAAMAAPHTPYAHATAASPQSAPYQGSTVLAERRARKRGSVLKTILLILFGFVAIVLTVGIVGGLSIFSRISETQHVEQQRHDTALDTVTKKLAQSGVAFQGEGAKIEFFDDGCIVSGTGYDAQRRAVQCEVSIEIFETETQVVWQVDYVKVDGEMKYTRTAAQ
jgi:DNA-directed RNA polymerase subunit RPC12/RpoP